jgi:hypothetical protein
MSVMRKTRVRSEVREVLGVGEIGGTWRTIRKSGHRRDKRKSAFARRSCTNKKAEARSGFDLKQSL